MFYAIKYILYTFDIIRNLEFSFSENKLKKKVGPNSIYYYSIYDYLRICYLIMV